MQAATKRFNWSVVAAYGLGGLLLCALLLRFPPDQYEVYVCPFHALTGLLCPGCGGTRAVMALLHGDWAAAWRWNALVVSLLPFGVAYLAGMARRVADGRTAWTEPPRAVWVAVVVGTVGFGVMRNLPGWS